MAVLTAPSGLNIKRCSFSALVSFESIKIQFYYNFFFFYLLISMSAPKMLYMCQASNTCRMFPPQELTWPCAGQCHMANPGKMKPSRYGRGRADTPAWPRWTALQTTRSLCLSSTRRATRTIMKPSPWSRSTCTVGSRVPEREVSRQFSFAANEDSFSLVQVIVKKV